MIYVTNVANREQEEPLTMPCINWDKGRRKSQRDVGEAGEESDTTASETPLALPSMNWASHKDRNR